MGTWMNSDGLYVKYGTSEGVSTFKAGEYEDTIAGMTILEITVPLTSLTETETILSDAVFIPANAFINWVETVAIVGAATGVAIDVGLIARDRSTAIDYDGLLAAAPTSNMNTAGETSRYQVAVTIPTGLTGTGALVGTEVTTAGGGYVSASRTTATAFTAGTIKIRIAYTQKGYDNP